MPLLHEFHLLYGAYIVTAWTLLQPAETECAVGSISKLRWTSITRPDLFDVVFTPRTEESSTDTNQWRHNGYALKYKRCHSPLEFKG
jgi:hypothetical protein